MEKHRDNAHKKPEQIRDIQEIVGFLGQVSAKPVMPEQLTLDFGGEDGYIR